MRNLLFMNGADMTLLSQTRRHAMVDH